MPEPEDYPENDWRRIYKRHALRTSTCDVCHLPVEPFTMWQELTPGAEDGSGGHGGTDQGVLRQMQAYRRFSCWAGNRGSDLRAAH